MQRNSERAWWIAAAVLLLPLLSMAILPLSDTSEPRYAEIARVMAVTGDWITPWFSPGVPFWGKPPLSFWAEAASMRLLGVGEFTVRLPSWLCMLASVATLYAGLRRLRGSRLALWSVIVYASGALVYISSGAVLTDPFLALGTTLSMISFAVVVASQAVPSRIAAGPEWVAAQCYAVPGEPAPWYWRYGFFLGLAIGLLAKGPLAAVLIATPVAAWLVLHRRRAGAARRLPWAGGLLLMLLISVPWYILAELKTPGFLDYFIVGEHIRRFLDPGWAGDLYGSAHRERFGMIWVYWLQASFPWGVLVVATLAAAPFSHRVRTAVSRVAADPLAGYWLAWAVFTPIFFTLSANILWTYVLPALAAFSILAAMLIQAASPVFPRMASRAVLLAALVPAVVLVWSVWSALEPNTLKSERNLVRFVAGQNQPGTPLVYLGKTPFSATFYSAGKAGAVTAAALAAHSACTEACFLAVSKDNEAQVARMLGHPLAPLYQNKRYVLIKIDNNHAPRALARFEGVKAPPGTGDQPRQ
ncbi:phospholipid carrier-dependent glycosyltransferase [Pusillimonas sp. TS35]|uniref:ArnT family glycosyltransferase n=1 Tax=Paracandidimonas lactea TaxID=2895524 RepID=UPI00136D4572|nr:glycosyltransferase family 39 protein [Paracandidimonas lactea]MYN12841.1 phospholipid carrier-dependent glycosyltransferase [Pusillimonas sp. TS35]